MVKLKVKKTILKRKIDGATLTGYYGRVISNGKIGFSEIARNYTRNTTIHPSEAEMAARMLVEGASELLKQGYIVDLGPLGTLYPAVNGPWKQNPDDLSLAEMQPKVNFKASDDVAGAIKAATLAWTNAEEEDDEGTTQPGGEISGDDDDDTTTTTPSGGDGPSENGDMN